MFQQARYYDVNTGTFISRKTTGQDGPNLYWYARNNPTKFVDIDGRRAAVRDTGHGTSCYYIASQVKESCQANLNRATLYSESILLGARCGTGPGFALCAGVTGGTVGTGVADVIDFFKWIKK